MVEHGKQYKNDVAVLRKMAREAAAGGAQRSAEVEAMARELAAKAEGDAAVKAEVLEMKAEEYAKVHAEPVKREVRVKREL